MAEVDEASKPMFAGLSDVSISADIPVEGDISVPGVGSAGKQDDDFSTLDEPVRDTIMRDLKVKQRRQLGMAVAMPWSQGKSRFMNISVTICVDYSVIK